MLTKFTKCTTVHIKYIEHLGPTELKKNSLSKTEENQGNHSLSELYMMSLI